MGIRHDDQQTVQGTRNVHRLILQMAQRAIRRRQISIRRGYQFFSVAQTFYRYTATNRDENQINTIA